MFSMAVSAVRTARFVAAAALGPLLAPGAAAAAPAAQASASHSAVTSGYGGSCRQRGPELGRRHAPGCWYSYGGSSCSRATTARAW